MTAACREPTSTLLRVQNPGPATVVVGRTLVRPGSSLACVPTAVPPAVAIQVAPPARGQPALVTLTPDGSAAVGRPVVVIARGPRSTTAVVDMGRVVAVPLGSAPLRQGPTEHWPAIEASEPAIDAARDPRVADARAKPAPEIAASIDGAPPASEPVPRHPTARAYQGRYLLTSTVDLAGAQTFGAPISDAAISVSEFPQHPTPVLVAILALFYPEFHKFWDKIPDAIQSVGTKLVDPVVVAVINALPGGKQIASFIGELGNIPRSVTLETELWLSATEDDSALRGGHVLKRLHLQFRSYEHWLTIPSRLQDLTQHEVSAALAADPHGSSTTLALGPQRFSIRYGELLFDEIVAPTLASAGAGNLGQWLAADRSRCGGRVERARAVVRVFGRISDDFQRA